MRPGVIDVSRPLLLGSASPRRREILEGLRIPIRIVPADIREDTLPAEAPLDILRQPNAFSTGERQRPVHMNRVILDGLAGGRSHLAGVGNLHRPRINAMFVPRNARQLTLPRSLSR